jgi:MFS family permease
VPLRVFASRPLRSANIVVLLFSAALFPMWFLTSLYLQKVLRMPPLGAGLAFLPMALTIMACATRAGGLVARFGARSVLGFGLIPLALGMALFAALLKTNGSYGGSVLAPGLLAAIGIGFSIVPATIVATTGVRAAEAGLASGLINTARQMGGALGLAILASVAAQFTAHLIDARFQAPLAALTNGFRLAYLIGAVFAAGAVVATFLLVPRAPHRDPAGAGAPGVAPPAGAPPQGELAPAGAPEPARSEAPTRPDASPAAPAAAPGVLPAGSANGGAPPAEQPPSGGPPSRPRSREQPRVTAVVFSLGGGDRWAMAAGSMTIQMASSGERVEPGL